MKLALLIVLLMLPAAYALDLNGMQVATGPEDTHMRQLLQGDDVTFVTAQDVDAGRPLLIIGGPCGNALWEQYSSITCENWPYSDGEGIVLSVRNGTVTLLAGTQQADTERLVEQFITSDTQESESADRFTIEDGQSRSVLVDSKSVPITDVTIDGTVKDITIDGQRFTNLNKGRSITTDDLLVEVLNVSGDTATLSITGLADEGSDSGEITVKAGDTETLTVNGEDVDIEGLQINDSVITDVTIDGHKYTDLRDGSVKTSGKLRIEVTGVNDDEATFLIEETDSSLGKDDEFRLSDGDDQSIEIEGENVEFRDVTVADDKVSMTVDGTGYSDLTEGDAVNSDSSKMLITRISGNDVTLVVD